MKHVALIIETSRSYGRELLRGVKRYISEHGHWSVFVEIRDLESAPPLWLESWKGDGILTRSGNAATYRAVTRTGVPAIELRATRFGSGLPFMGIDNVEIGRLVAQHFLDRGFRHFGVYELDTEEFFIERRDSFIRTLAERGYHCASHRQEQRTEKPLDWELQQAELLKWIGQLPRPVGILACTDQLGCWLLDACRRAGARVPEEIAVVGAENDESLCEMSLPPLSSVRFGGERLGYLAAQHLDALMHGKRASKPHLILPPDGIIVRQSSDVVAVSDEWLSAALSTIRLRACSGLTVQALLEEVPISRSKLERGFREILGRSPNTEINRVRLDRVKELLRDTDLNLDQIATRTGFASQHYLIDLFGRTFGLTPGAFRRQAKLGHRSAPE
ncbi:MAG: XylR family transcriptional regulator [Planctomycetota bacterium]